MANLNLLGVLFPGRPPIEVTRPASRGIALGVAISVLTGVFLFAPRATVASVNWIFQLKMALLGDRGAVPRLRSPPRGAFATSQPHTGALRRSWSSARNGRPPSSACCCGPASRWPAARSSCSNSHVDSSASRMARGHAGRRADQGIRRGDFRSRSPIHIMGIMLSVGTLVWFDLRLLGVSMTGYRASVIYRRLMPWMFTGFALMFIYRPDAGHRVRHGGVRQSVFPHQGRRRWCSRRSTPSSYHRVHRAPNRRVGRLPQRRRPGARFAGLVSICVWAIVIMAGRMMSYTMF